MTIRALELVEDKKRQWTWWVVLMLWDYVVVVVWHTGFFAVEVRKSTCELVVAILRGYLTGAVRDVMDRGCDGYFLIKKCQVYLDHFCARSIFERVLDKYTWI